MSARVELREPAEDAARRVPWPLRASDVDLHGHVNNTVYWQALEHVLAGGGDGPDVAGPMRVRLEFREPLDLDDAVVLAVAGDERRLDVAFLAAERTKAVALLETLPP